MTAKERYPNNKPGLFTEPELAAVGKAVTTREPMDAFGRIPVWTVDVFGRVEFHFLKP